MVSEPLGHLAPLDGIRAIAVVAVLLYHARFPWIPGGYLGVSTFFTLSGFLITSLLLREWNSTGGVSLRSFWVRRVRRLLPAAWAVLALVVAAGALGWWDHEQLRHLRGDVPWSLLQVVNWHFVAADRSYSDAFAAPSPLEHYWSLAIEQQFYLLFPLVALAVLRAGPSRRPARHRVRNLALVLAVLAAGSLAVNGLLADGSVDRAYFGSDTRLAELLVGALLATATVRRLRLPSPAAPAAWRAPRGSRGSPPRRGCGTPRRCGRSGCTRGASSRRQCAPRRWSSVRHSPVRCPRSWGPRRCGRWVASATACTWSTGRCSSC